MTPGAQPAWLSGQAPRWTLLIRAQPGARASEAVGEHGDALRIKVAAPPVDGKANDALLRWLAGRLDIALRDVELQSGASSRTKRVSVSCALTAEELVARLLGKG